MNFVIYSKPNCVYCNKAKALFKLKGLVYEERILDVGQRKEEDKTYVTRDELLATIPTAKTMPQIMLDDKVIGGFIELQQLIGA